MCKLSFMENCFTLAYPFQKLHKFWIDEGCKKSMEDPVSGRR